MTAATLVPLASQDQSAQEATLKLLTAEAGGNAGEAGRVELELRLPAASLEEIEGDGRRLTRLQIPGLVPSGDIGSPALPVLRRLIEVPPGAEISLQVEALDVVTIGLSELGLPALLEPVQLPIPKCDCAKAREWRYQLHEAAYQGALSSPSAISEPLTMRGRHLAMLTLGPVTYLPEQALLEIAGRLRVRLTITGQEPGKAGWLEERRRLASPHFDTVLRGATLDLDDWGLDDPEKGSGWDDGTTVPIAMLIISPPELAGELQPFVDWKTSCGYTVRVATTEETGQSADEIRSFIREQYYGPLPPVYVILVGDSPQPLPTFKTAHALGGTDLPFVQMDDDHLPDMMIARWPVDDIAELVAMRDKILQYERPQWAAPWLNRALFLGGDEYSSRGWTTHQEVIGSLMAAPPNRASCTFWNGESGHYSTADLLRDIDSGRAWVVYSAHAGPDGWTGRPALKSGDIASMGNTGRYPIALSHACQTNMWRDHDDVFAEAAVVSAERGFVAFWGASGDTFWTEDDWLERGFFDAIIDADLPDTLNRAEELPLRSLAAACYAGLTEVSLHGTLLDRYYWEVYNLHGDPSLDPYTRQPSAMHVEAPEMVSPEATDSFVVQVKSSDGTPLAGALVGVTQEGSLLGAGISNSQGAAAMALAAPQEGIDLLVRVTAHNHLPSDTIVAVAGGEDGRVVLDSGLYRCDSQVTIDVFDRDLLKSQEPVTVTLGTSLTNTAKVRLQRVPGDVAHFRGSAILGKNLLVGSDQTLTVSYHDRDIGNATSLQKLDTAQIDCSGPIITGLEFTRAPASLLVHLETDEAGTTEVWYGPGMPPRLLVTDDTLSLQHDITLPDLNPCTQYLLLFRTIDAQGNQRLSKYFKVHTEGWQRFLSENLSSDPGWEISNGTAAGEGWAYGRPLGGEQDGYGGSDPVSGYTGARVYGLNLGGDAPAGVAGENELTLTTPPLDLSAAISAQLRYRRWLGVEANRYDNARIRVSVDGGASWLLAWENGGQRIDDRAWVEHVVPLPSAAGHAEVLVQWAYGSSDDTWQGCGWNIDDIVIEGEVPCERTGLLLTCGFETGDTSRWWSVKGE